MSSCHGDPENSFQICTFLRVEGEEEEKRREGKEGRRGEKWN